MKKLTATPFGRRAVTAAQLQAEARSALPAPIPAVDKWQVFRDLTVARKQFGLSGRSLTVLNALLSFFPQTELSGDGPLIVFPSNRVLGERAHGISEATLRRHLSALAEAGLILRHDSPNGKRYARHDTTGALSVAYGFDLRPLFVRAPEIASAAIETREAALQLRRLRDSVVLHLRDVRKLLDFLGTEQAPVLSCSDATLLDDLPRLLRRKADPAMLARAAGKLQALRDTLAEHASGHTATARTNGNDAQNERHIQVQKKDSHEQKGTSVAEPGAPPRTSSEPPSDTITLSLPRILALCPTLSQYAPFPVTDDHSLFGAARGVAPWIGISAETWQHAVHIMGRRDAAATVAALLEKKAAIRSPGAYLRSLSRKAIEGRFSVSRMLASLESRRQPALAPAGSSRRES